MPMENETCKKKTTAPTHLLAQMMGSRFSI